ncbi:hypothetical protein [Sulfitobacter geojensis]|uniref:hypothetical protein n=1 Tax=Sulfitobacter geojensis TaxID=1342299 RepID=UPI0012DD789B|nr:hypothetical protein [Sulfitobacter geojensis]NYI26918.1 hypothetical protein [Sulfitobacter geojensis]
MPEHPPQSSGQRDTHPDQGAMLSSRQTVSVLAQTPRLISAPFTAPGIKGIIALARQAVGKAIITLQAPAGEHAHMTPVGFDLTQTLLWQVLAAHTIWQRARFWLVIARRLVGRLALHRFFMDRLFIDGCAVDRFMLVMAGLLFLVISVVDNLAHNSQPQKRGNRIHGLAVTGYSRKRTKGCQRNRRSRNSGDKLAVHICDPLCCAVQDSPRFDGITFGRGKSDRQ